MNGLDGCDDEDFGYHFAMACGERDDRPDWGVAKEWMGRYPQHALFILDFMMDWEANFRAPLPPPLAPEDIEENERAVEKAMERFRLTLERQRGQE